MLFAKMPTALPLFPICDPSKCRLNRFFHHEAKSVFTVLEYELRYGLVLANGILKNGVYSET